jgi:hypothetical protein
MGEETKKENVAPKGTPASMNPKNNAMALQEQNGVTIPNKAAKTLLVYFPFEERIFLIFSGGRKERIIDTVKIIKQSKINILIVSYKKKFKASPAIDPFPNFKKEKTTFSEKYCIG